MTTGETIFQQAKYFWLRSCYKDVDGHSDKKPRELQESSPLPYVNYRYVIKFLPFCVTRHCDTTTKITCVLPQKGQKGPFSATRPPSAAGGHDAPCPPSITSLLKSCLSKLKQKRKATTLSNQLVKQSRRVLVLRFFIKVRKFKRA